MVHTVWTICKFWWFASATDHPFDLSETYWSIDLFCLSTIQITKMLLTLAHVSINEIIFGQTGEALKQCVPQKKCSHEIKPHPTTTSVGKGTLNMQFSLNSISCPFIVSDTFSWFEELTNYDQLKVRLMKYQKLPRITLLYLAFVFAACQCLCLCPLAWSENVRIEIFSNSVQFSSPPLQMQFQQQKFPPSTQGSHFWGNFSSIDLTAADYLIYSRFS